MRLPRLRLFAASIVGAVLSPAAAFEDRVELLFRPLQGEHLAISPDGRRVAYTTQLERRLGITILDLDRGGTRRTIAVDADPEGRHGDEPAPTQLRFLRWATPERLVFAPAEWVRPAAAGGGGPVLDGPAIRAPILAVDADGQRLGVLVDSSTFLETATDARNSLADLLKPAAQVKTAGDQPLRARLPHLDVLGFYPRDPEQLIVRTRGGYGPPMQYLVDVRTGSVAEFGGEWPAPPGEPQVYDWFRLKVVGQRQTGPGPAAVWQDEDLARVQRTLEEKFPRRRVDLADWSENRGRVVFRVTGGGDPGRVFVWQRPDDLVVELFRSAPWFVAAKFNETRPVRFAGGGGGQISGRITWPRQPRAGALPLLVVFPGSAGEGTDGRFDPEAQVFADQGFAVLQLDRSRATTGAAAGEAEIAAVPAAIAWLAARFPERSIEAGRVAALGRGDGGETVRRALRLQPERFRGGAVIGAPAGGGAGGADDATSLWTEPGLAGASPAVRAAAYRRIDEFFRAQRANGPAAAGAGKEVE